MLRGCQRRKPTRLLRPRSRSHTRAQDVGRIAKAAGVKHLALNHFVPGADPRITDADWVSAVRETWDGPLTLGDDGVRIDLE